MIKLVPLGACHASDLAALAGDDTITPWTTTLGGSPGQSALAFIERAQRRRAQGGYVAFAVCDAERVGAWSILRSAPVSPGRSERPGGLGGPWLGPPCRRLIGIAVLARDPESPEMAELGYWIGRAHRDRRYGTAAALQLVSRGFGRVRLAVIVARCSSANRASGRVVEKLGFRFVGLEPALEHPESASETIRRYEITRDEWLER